ncbi:hypothetical protein DWB61_01665 [Ancylomarina euxinus]|uniref:Replication-associated protein G2P N-terminal domain-containing protein n=1 Tax=Ancylomarina euxinus TaxID=2283627 RepID=A0A425Y8C6_9BACT|nr:phage/plasmid replication protein [Ancylomarina euxinus]MCZ4693383.1 hypothetical protein [Ancylomarina euxinus]MUP13611.1 hypothetical protein [Ancylomarina euxinus]RRG24743.1 hypothetical protein DWB61_01665 [Ancylomarina euxinus]
MDYIELSLQIDEFDFYSIVEQKGSKLTKSIYPNGIEWFHGEMKNLRIGTNGTRLKIKGSLNKFLNGHNLRNIGIKEVEQSIRIFEREFGVSFQLAEVLKLELGVNVLLNYPPVVYNKVLGEHPRLFRYEASSGLYYFPNAKRKNQHKLLRFYDKANEARKVAKIHFKNPKLLRYEMMLSAKEIEILAKRKLTAYDLFDPQIYCLIVDKAISEFQKIEILHLPRFKPPESLKDFNNLLRCKGVESVGSKTLSDMIREWQTRKIFSSTIACRCRDTLRKANAFFKSNTLNDSEDLGIELSTKLLDELDALKS